LESRREDGGEPGSAGWQQKVSGVFDVVGRGGGHPLAPGVRDDMERRLSADFSDVRIHTDPRAAESAEMVSAEAYTVGNEIVFGTGTFDPHSPAGKARLAHELSHVLQQRRGPVSGADTGGGVLVSRPSDSFEQEARTIASRVVPGAQAAAGSGARPDGEAARVVGQRAGQLALQRQPKTSPERPSPSAPVTSATRSGDEGGAANITTLEQDMGRILDQWEIAALEGVTQFVTNALSERLDAIESGSWESYIVGLVGNTLWAATAFFPPGMVLAVFSLSMAGILMAATPTVPRKSKSAIPEVTRLATDYINGVYKGLDGQRREKAAALLKLDPDATRYRAMAAMIRNSFARGMYDIDPTYVKIPMINQNAVRDALVDFATERLDLVAHVGEERTHTHDYRGDTWTESSIVEVAWVQGSPQYPPRLATLNAQSTDGGARTWTFRSWISPANKEAAIQQWLSKRRGPPATYQAWLIRGLSG
jgi:hypothetical protein